MALVIIFPSPFWTPSSAETCAGASDVEESKSLWKCLSAMGEEWDSVSDVGKKE